MGKVEKFVVLSVLLIIVGILVVSLTMDDPLKKDDVTLAAPPAATPVAATPVGATPVATLSSSVTTPTPAPVPEPAPMAIPAGSILKTVDGLQDSFMPDMRFYTWRTGDTFPILAQRFYGDLSRLATLRRVNEGRFDVQPGERVLIPLYDTEGAPPSVAVTGAEIQKPAVKPAVSATPVVAVAAGTPRVHVVKSGESLWKISKQELGAGSRWKEIYEANRDVLSSPEALRTGLKLRIP